MSTVLRSELSEKNKYWIDKHRYYELKHFCMQYNTWKKTYYDLSNLKIPSSIFERISPSTMHSDFTAKYAIRKAYYGEKIKLVEDIAKKTDEELWEYILKGVTEGLSYTYLKTNLGIPCSKNTYYDRYRRFFWLLSEYRQ